MGFRFIPSDYKIESRKIYLISVVAFSVVMTLPLIAELTIDLHAVEFRIILIQSIISCLFVGFVIKYPNANLFRWLFIVLVYGFIETNFLADPKTFHVIVFWSTFIPLMSLITHGVKPALIWTIVMLLTLIFNYFLVLEVVGTNYTIQVYALSYLAAGIIFSCGIIAFNLFLYSLLGGAYNLVSTKNLLIDKRNEELKKQTETLTASNDTKEKLFAIIGHDLRSPLASLKTLLELSTDKSISVEDFLNQSANLKKGVEHMYFTLNNLLHWAGSQLEGLTSKPVNTQLHSIVESNFNLFEGISNDKNITLINAIDTELSAWADADQINVVLRNLISNALKYTQEGGNVTVTGSLDKEFCQIEVTDNGIGMTEEQVTKLFSEENFSHLGTKGEKGTGLGLKICREMIELNDGKIWVESEFGQGSIFKLCIPAISYELQE